MRQAFLCASFPAIPLVSSGATVDIHVADARATLVALQNASLTHAQALAIAEMKGNVAVVRKLQEFKIPVTSQSFSDALYACAHGEQVTNKFQEPFGFDRTKAKIRLLTRLLDQIEASPIEFKEHIKQRISKFSPPDSQIHLEGYVVASGDGGGYTFGGHRLFPKHCGY